MATFTGTNSTETIRPDYVSPTVKASPAGAKPTFAADTVSALGGNDTINGDGGADKLYGGDGNDTVQHRVFWDDWDHGLTFTGTASFYGGSGNDTLESYFDGPGINLANATYQMYGEAGDDLLKATYYYPWSESENYGAGKDFLYGGSGNDTYVLQQGTDAVIEKAGEGYDTVQGWGDNYTLAPNVEKLQLFYGGDAAPRGFHGTGNDLDNVLIGTDDNDALDGAGGNDTIYGKAAGENYNFNTDADTIHGGAGNDLIFGGAGNADTWDGDDKLYGDDGNDEIYGHNGNDLFYGGTGNDRLWGQAGNDTLYGGTGADAMGGGSGNDTLYGEADNDVLAGTGGADKLSGGPGNDTYDFDYVSELAPGTANRDTILDFAGVGAAVGDRIDLSTIDANAGVAGNQAFVFGGSGAGHVWAKASGTDTLVQADVGGAAGPELEILVKSVAAAAWTAADFIL